jgi:hypothetical protein
MASDRVRPHSKPKCAVFTHEPIPSKSTKPHMLINLALRGQTDPRSSGARSSGARSSGSSRPPYSLQIWLTSVDSSSAMPAPAPPRLIGMT